jgi:hypothetical protein
MAADEIYTPGALAEPEPAPAPAPVEAEQVPVVDGDPYELVRVREPNGVEVSITRADAVTGGATILDKPAADPGGLPLPALTPEQAAAELAEQEAAGLAYDPAEHKVDEVLAYLADADPVEVERVQAAEADGKNRSTITNWAVTPEED